MQHLQNLLPHNYLDWIYSHSVSDACLYVIYFQLQSFYEINREQADHLWQIALKRA